MGKLKDVSLTNLNARDLWQVFVFLRNTSDTSSKFIELTRYQLLEPEKWDTLWQNRLDISDVQKETVKVFVANASEDPKIPGLAGWGGRVVKNSGADLFDNENSFVSFSRLSFVRGKDI